MAGKPDTWMPLVIGDYLKDTGRLTTEQHGAYLLLIMDYWVSGPPADDDEDLAAITKLDLKSWRRQRPKIERFFTVEGGSWRHKRIDEELAEARENAAKRSDRGKAGALARWDRSRPDDATSIASSIPQGSASGVLEQCPAPSPTPDGVRKDADASSVGSGKPIPTAMPVREAFEAYNDLARRVGLPAAKTLDEARRRAIAARLRSGGLEDWSKALDAVAKSRHCRGENDRSWRADLDFVCQPKSYRRLLEGFYGEGAEPMASPAAPTWAGPSEVEDILPPELVRYLAYCTWRELPERALITSRAAAFTRLKDAEKALRHAGWRLLLEKGEAA